MRMSRNNAFFFLDLLCCYYLLFFMIAILGWILGDIDKKFRVSLSKFWPLRFYHLRPPLLFENVLIFQFKTQD